MSGRRRKPFRVIQSAGGQPEINVTPLVDVVLVLLIIFMVVVPLVERAMAVATPPMEETNAPSADDASQLVLELGVDGTLRVNQEEVSLDRLEGHLRAALSQQKEKVVFFTAHDAASYERAVRALDAAKAAGAKTIGMLTEPLEAAAPAP